MGNNRSGSTSSALRLSVLALLIALAACSDGNDNSAVAAKPQAHNPVVEGPVTGGGADDCCILDFFGLIVDLRSQGYTPGTPFYAGVLFDEAKVGYLEREYFFSGTATSYIATEELHSDGIWNIEPAATAEYKSRLVVQRPANDADFNGTVVVEWFNVTGGLDAAPDWTPMHTELMREGYVWVGVSAQSVGIEGGGPIDIPLKQIDPQRYGSLHHPGDSFSYDIFSQAAQAVRHPAGLDPLQGLQVQRMIAVGESQSASRLVTYFNAVHPTVELFDGFIIHSRGDGSASLSQQPQADVATPEAVFLRMDLPEPVIVMQTETDIFSLNSVVVRQPDSATLRLWEVAGASHADNYTSNEKGQLDRGGDPKVADVVSNSAARAPFIYCDLPINDGPGHWVASAAIAAMNRWLVTGEAAPHAPRLALNEDGTDFEFDDLGNVKGGVRTPYVDAPVAVLSGVGQPPANSFCRLYGTTALFDANTLATLYPDKATYVNAIDTATDAAVAGGFLVPADAELIKERARTSDIGNP